MTYHLPHPLNTLFAGFNGFRHMTLRTIGSAITAFLFLALVAPAFINYINMQIRQLVQEKKKIEKNDWLLIKGSRGMRMEEVLGLLHDNQFDISAGGN